MPPLYYASGGKTLLIASLGNEAAKELKALLEEKHLYQKVHVCADEIIKGIYEQIIGAEKQAFADWLNKEFPSERFVLAQQQLFAASRAATAVAASYLPPVLTLMLPHPSLFCKTCVRRETFTPVWFTDLTNAITLEGRMGVSKNVAIPEGFQMFLLVYQCQRCLGKPESFLVRREGWTLSLDGRSPIERIEVPGFLPQKESKFYRDAVIAFGTGKTLAALFYLRTFIEQFGRRITGMAGKATGDEIFDAYNKTLPSDLRERMPSLKQWYDKLSEALHLTQEDTALFETSRAEIEKHFDMRRVFEIPETAPAVEPKAHTEAKIATPPKIGKPGT
jgi:hypothetical protein